MMVNRPAFVMSTQNARRRTAPREHSPKSTERRIGRASAVVLVGVGLWLYSVKCPGLVDAFEACRAEFNELEAGARGEVLDRAGNKGLTLARKGADSSSDMNADAADIVTTALDLASVESDTDWHGDRGELAV